MAEQMSLQSGHMHASDEERMFSSFLPYLLKDFSRS